MRYKFLERKFIQQTLLIAFITLLLFEISLRIIALLPGKTVGLQSDSQVGIIGIPNIPGELKTNSDGFNDRELDRNYPPKAVFIGDSFTFGVTPYERNFPYLIEGLLGGREKFPIANFGVPGTGPKEYKKMLQNRVLKMKPEWVIVTLFVGNDIDQSRPKLKTLIFLNEIKLLPDPMQISFSLNEYYFYLVGRKIITAIFQKEMITQEEISRCAINPETAVRLNPFLFRIYNFEIVIYERYYKSYVEDSYNELKNIALNMSKHATDENAKILFVIAPSETQLNQDLRLSMLNCLGKEKEDYDFDKPRKILNEFFESNNIYYIDLLPFFSKYKSFETYGYLDTHWNAFGNQIAADAIAEKIKYIQAQSKEIAK